VRYFRSLVNCLVAFSCIFVILVQVITIFSHMLIRFVVENYKSFKDEVEFNLLTGNFRRLADHVSKTFDGINLLAFSSIYGANASGKSNLMRAIEQMQEMAISDIEKDEEWSDDRFKLDKESKKKPTRFEIEFISHQVHYSYGFSYLPDRIIDEWLYEIDFKRNLETVLFERESFADKPLVLEVNDRYKETDKDKYRFEIYGDELLPQQLFLNLIFQRDTEMLEPVFDFLFDSLITVFPSSKYKSLIHKFSTDKDFLRIANQIIKLTGTGIYEIVSVDVDSNLVFLDNDHKDTVLKSLRSEENEAVIYLADGISYALYFSGDILKASKVMCKHMCEDGSFELFELYDESDGTMRIIDLIPALIAAFKDGGVYFIDELDRSMHPELCKSIVEMFLDQQNTNKGQLIITTHESNLLDLNILRQDEIWFVEKHRYGSSKMYSLSDFKPRHDKDIKKGYLQGRYGAIPFIANTKSLNW